ncbi:MAG: PDZ domain-containing protein [Deltaproteobacteria bacterium]|nr:PDZ domain-containing protein [Deltaproteobacteria bacterium]
MRQTHPVPSYVVVLAVLATAGVTGYAMLKAGLPPSWATKKPATLVGAPQFWTPWAAANPATGPGELAPIPLPGFMGPPGAPAQPGAFLPVGGPTVVHMVRPDTLPAHGDRGVCTQCHSILDTKGAPIAAIRSYSPLYHDFRGVCVNCHAINVAPTQASAPVAAAQPKAATPATAPTEAEFLGMELSPLTPVTATQFNIPADTRGLVVVEAEAQAATVGLKPGDVLLSVDGTPVRTLTDFFQVTRNGTLTSATLEVWRAGQRMAVKLTATPPTPPANATQGATQAQGTPPAAQTPQAGLAPPLQVNPIPTVKTPSPAKTSSSF